MLYKLLNIIGQISTNSIHLLDKLLNMKIQSSYHTPIILTNKIQLKVPENGTIKIEFRFQSETILPE